MTSHLDGLPGPPISQSLTELHRAARSLAAPRCSRDPLGSLGWPGSHVVSNPAPAHPLKHAWKSTTPAVQFSF